MTATAPEVPALLEIPVGSIGRDPEQPRKRFPTAEIEALADSLKAEGVLQPITVTPNRRPDLETPYLVLFGERRLLAARRAGFETVPCIVEAEELSPSDRLLRQIVENDQRAPLCLIDRAAGYVRAYDLSGLTDAEFCHRCNISLSLLSRFRWVLRRQGLIREALDEDLIGHLETARLFDRLPAVRQLRLLREARKTGERITLKYVRRMIAAAEAEELDRDPDSPEEAQAAPAEVLPIPPATEPDPPVLLRMTVEALDALLRRLGLDPHGEPGDRVRMLYELLEVNL